MDKCLAPRPYPHDSPCQNPRPACALPFQTCAWSGPSVCFPGQ